MENFMLFTSEYEISDELYFENTPVLKYVIKYPQFSSIGVSHFVGSLNTYYRSKADLLVELCRTTYYEDAVSNYRASQEMGFPFHEHDFCSEYTITNNSNCVLSLYTDEDRYIGGANGNTKRTSDNWNLMNECFLTIQEMFSRWADYREEILREIDFQIAWQINYSEGNYFTNYERRTKEFFDPESFYITQNDLNIYYQEMTVAPHSSGIVSFALPFVNGPIYPQVCSENGK